MIIINVLYSLHNLMKRIRHFGRILCMSMLFLNSKGYLYDFRRKNIKWKK